MSKTKTMNPAASDTKTIRHDIGCAGKPSSILVVHLVMPGGHRVRLDFLDRVKHQVRNQLPLLRHGVAYRSNSFFGQDYLQQLSHGERCTAGQCLAYMVAENRLPLTLAHAASATKSTRYFIN